MLVHEYNSMERNILADGRVEKFYVNSLSFTISWLVCFH
jgi:hypothetical protein